MTSLSTYIHQIIMKIHFYALLFFTFCVFSSQAQIRPGALSLEGYLDARYQMSPDKKDYYGLAVDGLILEANPQFSFIAGKRWLLGGGPYTYTLFHTSGTTSFTSLEANIRYYVNPEAPRTNYFIGLRPRLELYDNGDPSLGLNFGGNYFMRQDLSLEGKLYYNLRYEDYNIAGLELKWRPFFSGGDLSDPYGDSNPIAKNTWLLSGDLARISYSADNTRLVLNPSIGYFVSDGLLIGTQFSAISNFDLDRTKVRSGELFIAPFVRKYKPEAGKWHWFGEAGFQFEQESSQFPEFYKSRLSSWQVFAGVGTNLFISSHLAVDLRLIGQYFLAGDVFVDLSEGAGFPDIESYQVDTRLDPGPFKIGPSISVQYFLMRKD